MRRKSLFLVLVLVWVMVTACATFEKNTYATIGTLGVAYDTAMKGAADLKRQGKISEAQWTQIDKAGTEFYVVYNASIDAFKIWLKVKDTPSENKVLTALSEASLKLGKVQEYYNIWKGVK